MTLRTRNSPCQSHETLPANRMHTRCQVHFFSSFALWAAWTIEGANDKVRQDNFAQATYTAAERLAVPTAHCLPSKEVFIGTCNARILSCVILLKKMPKTRCPW